jgi:sugar phosphate isomerase/epimerase
MKIALFSGMFKAFPLRTAMENAGKIGYDGIEVMVGFGADHLDVRCTPARAAEIGRMADDNDLDICLIYTTLGGNSLAGEQQRKHGLDNVERFLDIGDRMSCKMLKVTAGRLKNSAYRDDEARVVADWLGKACDRAAKHRSRIVTEIHFRQYCETVDIACRMIALVDRPNFGVIHDAGNLHITGDGYGEDSVKRLGDRVFHVHIKDMVKATADDQAAHDYPAGRFKRALLNKGNVDHRPLFRALKEAGYGGYLSCEASGGDDPVSVAKHEFRQTQKLLSQV